MVIKFKYWNPYDLSKEMVRMDLVTSKLIQLLFPLIQYTCCGVFALTDNSPSTHDLYSVVERFSHLIYLYDDQLSIAQHISKVHVLVFSIMNYYLEL